MRILSPLQRAWAQSGVFLALKRSSLTDADALGCRRLPRIARQALSDNTASRQPFNAFYPKRKGHLG